MMRGRSRTVAVLSITAVLGGCSSDAERAERKYQKAVSLVEDAGGYVQAGEFAFSGGDDSAWARIGDARDLLVRAIELDPDHAGAHLALGKIYDSWRAPSMMDRAEPTLRRAVELDPESVEARVWLARRMMERSMYLAKDPAERALVIDELVGHLDEAARLRGGPTAEMHRIAGSAYQFADRDAEAAAAFAKAVALDPTDERSAYLADHLAPEGAGAPPP